jgi:hypothetical protein
MFNECKEIFEEKLGDSYGDYSPEDHQEFIKYLGSQGLMLEQLPYDLEEMIDEWIEQDSVYH